MKNIFIKISMVVIILSALSLPLYAEEDVVPQDVTKSKTVWEDYENGFLRTVEGLENEQIQKKQEIVDADIAYKLHINLEYTNLKKCLETALENNYNIKISNDIQTNRKWLYHNSQSKFIPDFYYQYQLSHINGEFLVGNILLDGLSESPVENNFSVGWLNINFPKTYFNMRASKNIYKASKYNFDFTKDEVILFTALEYYNLLARKLQIEVLRINLRESEEQLRMTQGRYMLGVGTRFDVLRAEAQVAQANQEYIAAYNNLRLNQAKLANVMGIEVLEPVYPYEMNIETVNTLDENYSIDYLYDTALKTRLDVKAREQEIDALKQQKKSIYMDYAPVLSLNYNHQKVGLLGDNLRSNNSFSLIGTVYLGQNLGVGTYTNLKAIDAQINEQSNRLIQLKRDIKENILNAYYDSLTSKDRIEAAKKEVAAGDEGIKNAIVRWEIGENTFIDVLQAQFTKTSARQELINAIIEYNKAQVRILFSTGIISVKAVLQNYSLAEPSNLHNLEP